MKKLLSFILSRFPTYWIFIILISLTVGVTFFSVDIGVYTFLGLAICVIAFVFLRQLWWWITKTGDYSETDNS